MSAAARLEASPSSGPADASPESASPERPPTDLIRSLRRGLAVLDYVAGADAPVSPRQVATALELNISTAYHLINTLLYDGYLVREATTGTLTLGAASAPHLRTAVPASPESVAVRRVLGRGAYVVEDTTVMALPQRGRALVIAAEAVPGGDSAGHYEVGSSHLLHGSAVGQVMLAMAPTTQTTTLLEQSQRLADLNGEPYKHAQVVRGIEQVRAHGVCFALGERDACVGAPVRDAMNRPVGAVAVVVSERRLREDPKGLARSAHRTAQALTRELTRWGVDARSAAGLLTS